MSDVERRDVLIASVGLATAALAAASPAQAGDLSFMNNVPDPLLSGAELPTFKFALEKSEGKVIGNSYGKEATVKQLPISKGIAGVSMRLEPGAMRELHWHATAAEWAYVIEGRVHTTVIDPQGAAETNDFDPATCGISRAAMATCCNASARSLATSFLFSITDIFPNLARSASPTGLAMRRSRFWLKTSVCRKLHLTLSPSRRFTLRAARSLPSSRPRRCKGGSCRRRTTNIACSV